MVHTAALKLYPPPHHPFSNSTMLKGAYQFHDVRPSISPYDFFFAL